MPPFGTNVHVEMTSWLPANAAQAQAVNRPPNVPPSAMPALVLPPPDLSFMRDLDLLTEELAIAKHEGIGCIVDAGHPDMGRDIGMLRELSSKSGMPIRSSLGIGYLIPK